MNRSWIETAIVTSLLIMGIATVVRGQPTQPPAGSNTIASQWPLATLPQVRSLKTTNPKPEPVYELVTRDTVMLPGSQIPVDRYYPTAITNPSEPNRLPIALLLQGFNVDKSSYSQFATLVARYGFVVLVPNHRIRVDGRWSLFAQVGLVPKVLAWMESENRNSKSPLYGALATEHLAVIGHSNGGFVGMDAIRNACDPPWCVAPYRRPGALRAGVFIGADLQENGQYLDIANDGIPMALIIGSRDSLISDRGVWRTYGKIQTPPKVFVRVTGANHYGLTDRDNPPGSPRERQSSQLPQAMAVETMARWTGLFLRAQVLNDPVAIHYVYRDGRYQDPNVIVVSQPVHR